MMRRTRIEHIWSGLASAPDGLRYRSEPTFRARLGKARGEHNESGVAQKAKSSGQSATSESGEEQTSLTVEGGAGRPAETVPCEVVSTVFA
jgi:hypothetical protein